MTTLASETDAAVASTVLMIVFFTWILPTVLAAILAHKRDRSLILGAILGAVFSWLGVLICLFLPAPPPSHYHRPRYGGTIPPPPPPPQRRRRR